MTETSFVPDEFEAPVTQDQLNHIGKLAQDLLDLDAVIERQQADMDAMQGKRRQLAERELPEALTAAGMQSFTMQNGCRIDLKTDVYPTIPAASQNEAFDWLTANKYGDVVKSEFKVDAGAADAAAARDALAATGLAYKEKRAVHPQTLKAIVRELLREGREVPACIPYFEARVAQVKMPK